MYRIHPHATLQPVLVFLAFTFSGRDASKSACACSGWKDCTQARGASQGLKGGLGESKHLMVWIWVVNIWVSPKLISALFFITISALFSHIFHRIWYGPESYSRAVKHNQASVAVSHSGLPVWSKLVHILPLHLLVQAASQGTDDSPYSSKFRTRECREWPLLCKLPESI